VKQKLYSLDNFDILKGSVAKLRLKQNFQV